MLELRIRGVDVQLSLLFPAAVVVLLSLDMSGMPLWCIAASAMHEAGHFLALYALGARPAAISVGLFGVRIVQDPAARLSYMGSFLVSLAGPVVNLFTFAVLAMTTGMTMPAAVHLSIGSFNLLPVGPLDGGQALYFALAGRWGEEQSEKIVQIVSILTLVPLAIAGFYLLIRSGYNFTLLAVSLYLGLLFLLKKR